MSALREKTVESLLAPASIKALSFRRVKVIFSTDIGFGIKDTFAITR